ncbi:MAG TPA: Rieske (2Fe-2S) protein [Verrucomicrobiota bacterium]|nr:(2Fe-2S)-binding protein [Verrucomicrobiales bacterium]HRI15586.1 Rieske (2Fe-2S) protein [Verrucomicrobiota bacterium]
MSAPDSPDAQPRRTFVKEAAAVVVGGVATAVPLVAGICVWLDPLRKSTGAAGAEFSRITNLDALPADGVPRKFTVVADRTDAWTRTPNVPVGALYLTRTGDRQVTALQCICPHAGCFLEYLPQAKEFLCPCHNSTFAVDGKINAPSSPSPRDMDSLEVELRGNEVWVRFQNFQAGHREKRAVA